MRIIERTNQFDKSVVYVVQDDKWNGAVAYQNGLGNFHGKPYQDIAMFPTLDQAKEFAHQYQNNLKVGERIVG